MAVIFMEGFEGFASPETGDSSLQDVFPEIDFASFTEGRFGGKALSVSRSLDLPFTTSTGKAVVGSAASLVVDQNTIMTFKINNEREEINILRDSQNFLKVSTDISFTTTERAVTEFKIPSDSWFYIEAKLDTSVTPATFEVWINGNKVVSVPDILRDFENPLEKIRTITRVNVMDDLYVSDDEVLGPQQIVQILPDGTVRAEFTATNAASNLEAINEETSNNDTDYNASETVGSSDLFSTSYSGTSPVSAVKVSAFAKQTEGSTSNIALLYGNGSSEIETDFFVTGSRYQYFNKILSTNPFTSSAWQEGDLSGFLIGYKVV